MESVSWMCRLCGSVVVGKRAVGTVLCTTNFTSVRSAGVDALVFDMTNRRLRLSSCLTVAYKRRRTIRTYLEVCNGQYGQHTAS